jgi:hypothetical protein
MSHIRHVFRDAASAQSPRSGQRSVGLIRLFSRQRFSGAAQGEIVAQPGITLMTFREMFRDRADQPDSPYAWLRLGFALVIGAIGGVGMWSVPVTLPAVQADFGVDRAAASLP